jgi:SOS-response transcriptional repressor LexA
VSRPLTEKQARVLAFVREEIVTKGRPPTAREIAAMLGARSTNVVTDYLWALERKGFIVRDRDVARGIRLVTGPSVARVAVEQAVAVRGRDMRGGTMSALFMPVTRAGEERRAA